MTSAVELKDEAEHVDYSNNEFTSDLCVSVVILVWDNKTPASIQYCRDDRSDNGELYIDSAEHAVWEIEYAINDKPDGAIEAVINIQQCHFCNNRKRKHCESWGTQTLRVDYGENYEIRMLIPWNTKQWCQRQIRAANSEKGNALEMVWKISFKWSL